MIQIYGHPATSAGRCYWLLEELQLPYERMPLDMRQKDHKSASFLAINPNGKVPAIVDGDFKLWESTAINQYLAEKAGKSALLGSTLQEKATVQQWTMWSMVEYQKPMIDLFIQLIFIPEGKRDQNVIDKSREKVGQLNELLDRCLQGCTYLVNEAFTLADLNVASVAKINQAVGIAIEHLPHLRPWLARISERPASQKVDAMARERSS